MGVATHDDLARLFPGIQDHSVLEIQATEATVDELEAALLLLQDDDAALIDIKQRQGSRLNLLLDILSNSDVQFRDDVDH